MFAALFAPISRALSRIMRTGDDDHDVDPFQTFNIQAVPGSPVDGLDVKRLQRILNAAHRGEADELFALYSDIIGRDATFIAGSLQRRAPLVARMANVSAPSKSAPQLLARRDILREQWANCKGKRITISHLLEASAWPMAYAKKIWKEAPAGSGRYYDLAELRPVPFWQITFRADKNGPAGVPKIKVLRPDGSWDGSATELPDPLHYVCHRGHLLQTNPDCWGGPMRAVVFWWYFATWARQAAANHLEGHNQPKWVAKYPRVEELKAKAELRRAFSRAVTTTALIVPMDAQIEAIATLKSEATDAFEKFIALCQREIAKVIVAQTLTIEAQATGMNSSQASEHGDQLDGIREFDAALLSETMEEQVLRAWLDLNGMAGGPVPSFSWQADDDAAAVKAEMLNDLGLAGLEVTDEGIEIVSGAVGVPLRRKALPVPGVAPGPGVTGFAAGDPPRRHKGPAEEGREATDRLAEEIAGDLADAFGVDFAEMSRAIREATGPADLMTRLAPVVAGLKPHRATRCLEEALATSAANGMLCSHATSAR